MILVLMYDDISSYMGLWRNAIRIKKVPKLNSFLHCFFAAEVIGHNFWIHIKELSKQMKRKSPVNVKHYLSDSCKMYSSIKISFILLAHLSSLFQFSPIWLLEPTHLLCIIRKDVAATFGATPRPE